MAVLKSVCCLKFCFGAILVSLLFEKCLSSCGGMNPCEKGMKFRSYKGSSGLASCCATDAPNLMSINIRSINECVLRCQETGKCLGVNWKQPNICEMFSVTPQNLTDLSGCEYLDKGEMELFSQLLCSFSSLITCRINE